MVEKRKISVAIPTYERTDMTIESFIDVHDDERVGEIVIVDDASDWEIYHKLEKLISVLPKVRLHRNIYNRDCYFNKMTTISLTSNNFSILLDSDNKIGKDYLDRIFDIPEWDEKTIYTPAFAKPHFDFRAYSGLIISKETVSQWVDKPMFETCLNAANFFVNKNEYLKVWDGTVDPVTSDSIYFCMKWLEAGNKIRIVPGLTYIHTVHSGSHYKNNVHRTPNGFHESILNKLKSLS